MVASTIQGNESTTHNRRKPRRECSASRLARSRAATAIDSTRPGRQQPDRPGSGVTAQTRLSGPIAADAIPLSLPGLSIQADTASKETTRPAATAARASAIIPASRAKCRSFSSAVSPRGGQSAPVQVNVGQYEQDRRSFGSSPAVGRHGMTAERPWPRRDLNVSHQRQAGIAATTRSPLTSTLGRASGMPTCSATPTSALLRDTYALTRPGREEGRGGRHADRLCPIASAVATVAENPATA
jgi:hypothetical protein